MRINRFEDIEAWKQARDLTQQIYACTRKPAFSRDYGLKDQIQRAAGSMMHNVAEGFDAGSNAEFIRFLRYAQRSGAELQSELYVALDQKYISQDEFNALYSRSQTVRVTIGAFIKYLLEYNRKPRTKNLG